MSPFVPRERGVLRRVFVAGAAIIVAAGCVSKDPSASLKTWEGEFVPASSAVALIAEGEDRVSNDPVAYAPGSRCWIDETPGARIARVVCGPLAEEPEDDRVAAQGPPYFLGFRVLSDGNGGAMLSTDSFPESFANPPSQAWRPDALPFPTTE